MYFKSFALAAVIALAACARAPENGAADKAPPAQADAASLLAAAIDGPQRSEEDKARDKWRHPKETLEFFGVEPSMTVVEVWPGGGWYARILAPYLKSGNGTYYAAHLNPAASANAAAAIERFRAEFSDAEIYGDVKITALGVDDIAPEGTADVVLTFRNIHNWVAGGAADENFKSFYKALKPGGVLGVVEHRADEASGEDGGKSGYVKESTVKALAEAAGFEFAASSEINANPNDTKDHPFGVWTLPPVRRSSAAPGQEAADFDRSKYDAIGESDRMTLKFVKPKS